MTAARALAMRRLKRRRVHIVGEPPLATKDVAYAYAVDIRGWHGPFVLTAEGTLPTGLSVVGNSITGTPTVAGTQTVFLLVTDAGGVHSQKRATFVVQP